MTSPGHGLRSLLRSIRESPGSWSVLALGAGWAAVAWRAPEPVKAVANPCILLAYFSIQVREWAGKELPRRTRVSLWDWIIAAVYVLGPLSVSAGLLDRRVASLAPRPWLVAACAYALAVSVWNVRAVLLRVRALRDAARLEKVREVMES